MSGHLDEMEDLFRGAVMISAAWMTDEEIKTISDKSDDIGVLIESALGDLVAKKFMQALSIGMMAIVAAKHAIELEAKK